MASDFPHPYPLRPRGSALARRLLALFGWRLAFDGLPAPQGVIVVYPHTSNWDFVVMILAKWALGVRVRFWGKDRLFRIPLFGRWLRWVGGVPVARHTPQGITRQALEIFARRKARGEYFWLCLAPEGTRKRIPGWRSGFYRTALGAGVPLGLVRLDYARREITAVDFIRLSGDEASDMARVAEVYRGVQGKVPSNAAPIRLLDPAVSRADTIGR